MNGVRIFAAAAVFVAVVGWFALVPGAQSSEAPGANWKIAVVDAQVVMEDYNVAKDGLAELEQQVSGLDKQFEGRFKQIDEQRKQYLERRASLSPDEQDREEQRLNELVSEYEADLRKEQRDIDFQRDKLRDKIKETIEAMIQKIGDEEGYHLILQSDVGVLYSVPAIDISSQVVTRLNAQTR